MTVKDKNITEVIKLATPTREEIKQVLNQFVDEMLTQDEQLKAAPVRKPADASIRQKIAAKPIPREGRPLTTAVSEMLTDIYAYGDNMRHPRHFGFVPGPSSLVSWLGDVLSSAYNVHAAEWTVSPTAVEIEQKLVRWFCDKVGYGPKASGVFVSGGSMATLTALVAARHKILTPENQHLGTAYISNQTHSSVIKDLHVIGLSDRQIRKIPVDADFRLDVNALKKTIMQDKANGAIPFLVIATAGTTNTGSIDPLKDITAICRNFNMWLHVDGAFGASILLSQRYRHVLDGIAAADSVSWDGHKWLFQTYSSSMVLVKDKADLLNSYYAHPEYLKDLESKHAHFNPADMSIELTRPARALKLWLTLQVLGSDKIGAAIDHGVEMTQYAEKVLRNVPQVEITSPAQLAMITFRYAPQNLSEAQQDELNQQISQKMLATGFAGVYTTELNGHKVLRLCIINPNTAETDIKATIQKLTQICQNLVQQHRIAVGQN